jgi:hypothetical protein
MKLALKLSGPNIPFIIYRTNDATAAPATEPKIRSHLSDPDPNCSSPVQWGHLVADEFISRKQCGQLGIFPPDERARFHQNFALEIDNNDHLPHHSLNDDIRQNDDKQHIYGRIRFDEKDKNDLSKLK